MRYLMRIMLLLSLAPYCANADGLPVAGMYVNRTYNFRMRVPRLREPAEKSEMLSLLTLVAPPERGGTALVCVFIHKTLTLDAHLTHIEERSKTGEERLLEKRQLKVGDSDAVLTDTDPVRDQESPRSRTLAVFRKDHALIIVCMAPSDRFNRYEQEFNKCLDSLCLGDTLDLGEAESSSYVNSQYGFAMRCPEFQEHRGEGSVPVAVFSSEPTDHRGGPPFIRIHVQPAEPSRERAVAGLKEQMADDGWPGAVSTVRKIGNCDAVAVNAVRLEHPKIDSKNMLVFRHDHTIFLMGMASLAGFGGFADAKEIDASFKSFAFLAEDRDNDSESVTSVDVPAKQSPVATRALRKSENRTNEESKGSPVSVTTSSSTPPVPVSNERPQRWLGHTVATGAEHVSRLASHANLILDESWGEHGDAVIEAARSAGVKVVLVFNHDSLNEARTTGIELAKKNRDVVVGLCWRSPYYHRFRPADLEDFGTRVHEASPGSQFWVDFVEKPRGRYQTNPVPPQVDVLIMTTYFDTTPYAVRMKVADTLPGWLAMADGRPVLLRWCAWDRRPPGLVPKCKPGTMQAYAQIVEDNRLAGLVLGHYGENSGCDGFETNSGLLQEIREISKSLGID